MKTETIEEFKKRGGNITQVEEGETAFIPGVKYCRCGCNGNYTEHSMRAGESGRDSSVIINR